MRRALIISLCLLAAPFASAQKRTAWQEVAPPDEEFSVRMPTTERMVMRELSLTDELRVGQPVYEVSADGLHFMVVSFEKSVREGQPILLETFAGFAKGFEHSVLQRRQRAVNMVQAEEDFMLRGMKIRPYLIRMSGREGVARLYEAPRHFYAVVVLGATYGDARVDRFLKSFTVKTGEPETKRTDDGNDLSELMTMTDPRPVDPRPQPAPPDEPWPIYHPRGVVVLGVPVDGDVLNGRVLSKPQPTYPRIAIAARAQGTVTVEVIVDEEGYVISARAVEGHPLLQQAAVQAARQVRFTPTRLEGVAVKVIGVITYNFVLN
jgi:TonB family protein